MPTQLLTLPLVFLLLCSPIRLLSQSQGDQLRAETRLDEVYQQYDLKGKNVIVALIERGIDYRHPDFIDPAGNTRLAYVYDMIDESGANAANNPYGTGTIYERAEIDLALSSGNFLGSTDRYGHGTACMGLAAGDGSGTADSTYRGVATQATLIAVKMVHDPFPATGNIVGQSGSFTPSDIPTALDFVKDKATELGLPVVCLINLGSIGGPTDGSSVVSRAMTDFVGPGRILICGVGDDGGGANRAADTLALGETSRLEIYKARAGNLRFEAWYEGDDRFDVRISNPDGTVTGPFPSPVNNQNVDTKTSASWLYYHRGSDQDFDQADNGQRQILIDIFGDTGVYVIELIGNSIRDGKFFASLNPALYSTGNGFLTQVFPGGSINDYASSARVIVPTDYVYDTTYVDLDGIARQRGNQGAVGDLWIGSSAGPTLDGRLGVDVAVPGELSVGAYSPETYYAQFRFNMVQDGNGLYGLQTAVSAAAPVLTGVIALMLEINPQLTYEQVQALLHQSARTDAFTGSVPNARWGYGKLDALAAIQATQALTQIQTPRQFAFRAYPNPSTGSVQLDWQPEGSAPLQLEVLDGNGRRVLHRSALPGQKSLELDLSGHPPGPYLVHLFGPQTNAIQTVILTP
ncbi:MAG: S8 family serine peptidase [Bacteroidota bacterium]